jgi:SAM-dependent methyltransferase
VPFERNAYDLVILGHICHGEGEAGSRKLIKKCFDALKPGGRILIAEFLSNDLKTGPEIPLLFAVNMLLLTPQGDVFSAKDFKRWLNLGGFKKVSTLAVQYPVSVVVGIK